MTTKLDAKALGLAGGILWGAACMIMALAAMAGYAGEWVSLLGTVYIGYAASAVGVLLGAVYGFLDGFIGLYIIAWLYNKFN